MLASIRQVAHASCSSASVARAAQASRRALASSQQRRLLATSSVRRSDALFVVSWLLLVPHTIGNGMLNRRWTFSELCSIGTRNIITPMYVASLHFSVFIAN